MTGPLAIPNRYRESGYSCVGRFSDVTWVTVAVIGWLFDADQARPAALERTADPTVGRITQFYDRSVPVFG